MIKEDYSKLSFSDFDNELIEKTIERIKKLRKKYKIISVKSDYEDVEACYLVEAADLVIDCLESLLSEEFDTVEEFVDALKWCENQAGSSYGSELLSHQNIISSISV